jgi:hypothetical protein
MATRRLGIVMYGVTGRMGLNQHLVRSILAAYATFQLEGGVIAHINSSWDVRVRPIKMGSGITRSPFRQRHTALLADSQCGKDRGARTRIRYRTAHDKP